MKAIGIVGGIGPESTVDYYRLLELAGSRDHAGLTGYLLGAVEALAIFAANTPHIVFDEVRQRSPIELVSIVSATCDAAQGLGMKRVGLLGTRFTMQGRFYPDVFDTRGIAVVAPGAAAQEYVHEKYVSELVAGRFLDETRTGFLDVIDRMQRDEEIERVILGGTELPLLLRESRSRLPLLDTTRIHVDAVVARVTAGSPGRR